MFPLDAIITKVAERKTLFVIKLFSVIICFFSFDAKDPHGVKELL
jgi:hypothetical protein